jgi:homoserine kinase
MKNDMDLIQESLCDLIIEPQREKLIPGFQGVKSAALLAGALGVSISGSGPSVFAWANGQANAKKVKVAMEMAFAAKGLSSTSWISRISKRGAQISK